MHFSCAPYNNGEGIFRSHYTIVYRMQGTGQKINKYKHTDIETKRIGL